MSSTHLSLNVHVIFSTKNREPCLEREWLSRLHEYLGGTLRNQDVIPLAAGGVWDHVHLLMGLRSTHRLSDIMREVKSESSRWLREQFSLPGFAGQEGYGAISVSPSHLEDVRRYVLSQEEHHRVRTFQEEYRGLLEKCGIPFKEEYLW